MILWINKYKRFLCLLMASAYMFVASGCGPWLVEKTAEIGFAVVADDYPCKGSGCGCVSAYKCITDCCCSKKPSPKESVISCCSTVKSITTCCSSDQEEIAEKEEQQLASQNNAKMSPLGCRGGNDSISMSTRVHVLPEKIAVVLYIISSNVEQNSTYSFSPQNIVKVIDKVPIV